MAEAGGCDPPAAQGAGKADVWGWDPGVYRLMTGVAAGAGVTYGLGFGVEANDLNPRSHPYARATQPWGGGHLPARISALPFPGDVTE